MTVEGQGTGFWTGVRLPSNPLDSQASNPSSYIKIAMYKNIFAIIFELRSATEKKYPLTYGGIQKWVRDEYQLDVSRSSIGAVRDKCQADTLKPGAAKATPCLKSDKEKAIYDAFKAFGVA